ncbi:hypothetical protein ACFOMD_08745 [Sphingoaurantiacus capsulatus]|uniref:Uncharacterized protein n=1 Tax=Sphingoaurantiacus capsulatus TaxID=1771310 RepID=A0ABV7X9S6_9SPHN
MDFGRTEAALAAIEPVIAEAEALGPAVNEGARVAMHGVRACALHELGRSQDASSANIVTAAQQRLPASYMALLACTGRLADARSFLMSLLANRDRRSFPLIYLQPVNQVRRATPSVLRTQAFRERLRSDDQLMKAVARHGRVLDFVVEAPAPERR